MRPCFEDLPSLGRYLHGVQERRETLTAFRLAGQMTETQLHQALDDMTPLIQRSSRRLWREREGYRVTMTMQYREGVRLAGGQAQTEQERAALTLARRIVQERSGLKDIAAWLAEHVTYENPRPGFRRYSEIVGCVCALMEGRANCQGISDAMYLLGSLAGYEMTLRQGRNGRGNHLWSMVRVEGVWYALDVTPCAAQGEEIVLMDEKSARAHGLVWENWAGPEESAAD